ncbi:MAG: ycdF 1 [Alphaproteobacteria bacterium]|nr:ycdF 1 [Alphaproteobacteria bacterium]
MALSCGCLKLRLEGARMDHEFTGKTALITAGGAGIGRAIALEWAGRGGTAIVTDLVADDAEQVAADIRAAGGTSDALALDVQSREMIEEVVPKAAAFAGGIDALFNVAGTNLPRTIEELDEADWYRLIDVNLTSVYRLSRLVIPQMRARGGGAIVNIASVAAIMAENRCPAYSASKAGVAMLTRNMAIDFARDNIRVNAICPGSTRTPRIERYWKNSPTGVSEIATLAPMNRSAEPEEIARPALFLASAGASYMTGSIVVVDGGLSAGLVVPTFERM